MDQYRTSLSEGQNPLAGIEVMWGILVESGTKTGRQSVRIPWRGLRSCGASAMTVLDDGTLFRQNPLVGIEVMWGPVVEEQVASEVVVVSESPGGD